MPKFPVDAPLRRVIKALEKLGFRLVREGKHIAMECDGARKRRWLQNTAYDAQSQHAQKLDFTNDSDSGWRIQRRFPGRL